METHGKRHETTDIAHENGRADTVSTYDRDSGIVARWYAIARRYAERVPAADRLDVCQDIVLALCQQERKDGQALPQARARAIAHNTMVDHYRRAALPRPILPLETDIQTDDSDAMSLSEAIADTEAIDLSEAIDAANTLAAVPEHIRQLGERIIRGEHLNTTDRKTLSRFRLKYRSVSQNAPR